MCLACVHFRGKISEKSDNQELWPAIVTTSQIVGKDTIGIVEHCGDWLAKR